MKNEKIYLLTDLCMWEANKKNKTFYPHAIEVVDIETGAIHFIKSGSRIAFIDGQITARATQETYKKTQASQNKKVSPNRQSMPKRKGSKESGKASGATSI